MYDPTCDVVGMAGVAEADADGVCLHPPGGAPTAVWHADLGAEECEADGV